MRKKNTEKGFTMMEVLAAISLITMGVLGIFTLVQQAISFLTVSSSRLVATYLAQEGVEIVRNIRDTNFLQIHQGLISEDQWTLGLDICGGGCEAEYDDQILSFYANRYLKLVGGGFYNYSSGASTPFKRKITIFDMVDLDSPPDGIADIMKVLVEVTWEERGRIHQVITQENLYNWQ